MGKSIVERFGTGQFQFGKSAFASAVGAENLSSKRQQWPTYFVIQTCSLRFTFPETRHAGAS
jgi:hypothetical protein